MHQYNFISYPSFHLRVVVSNPQVLVRHGYITLGRHEGWQIISRYSKDGHSLSAAGRRDCDNETTK